MNKLLMVLAFAILTFTWCQEENSILQPDTDSEDILSKYDNLEVVYSNAPKKKDRSTRNQINGLYSNHFLGGAEIVELKSFKVKHSKNYTVDGKKGGKIFLQIEWKDEDGKKVKLESKLTIPIKAYKRKLTFDMIFDLENFALELYPSPFTFDHPVKLDLKFENIDLSNVDLDNLNFTYLDGEEEMKYKSIKHDIEKGKLEVKGAELHHFSRYGWSRRR